MTDDLNDLRAALGTLAPDEAPRASLVADGVARGRRLRTRRRVVAVAGAAASVALVVGVGAVVTTAGRDRALPPAGTRPLPDTTVWSGEADGPLYVVATTTSNGTVCFEARRPDRDGATDFCVLDSTSPGTAHAADLGDGWALLIAVTAAERAAVGVEVGDAQAYLPTTRVAPLRGLALAFHPYRGRSAAPPRFVALQSPDCSELMVTEWRPDGERTGATPEEALDLAMAGVTAGDAPRAPVQPYLRVPTGSPDAVAFVHFDEYGSPDYEVDVVRTRSGGWLAYGNDACRNVR